jgi:ribose transport system substrate-binding protein
MQRLYREKEEWMRRGQVLAVLLAVSLAVLLAACGAQVRESGGGGGSQGGGEGKGANAPVRLAVVPRAIGFSFWEQVRLGAQCATKKAPGDVSMQWDGTTSEADVNGQVNILQNYITQGVDGLAYSSIDEAVDAKVTKQAIQQGITVVNFNTGTNPQPPDVPLFTTDQVAATRKAVDPLAEAIGGKGEVAIIEFQPGLPANEQRVNPLKEGLKKDYPDIHIVAEQSSGSEYDKALQVTEDILTAHPNLNAIFAANEPSVLGAAEAVRGAHKTGDIVIVGWDASSAEVKALKAGVIKALVAQNPFRMGYEGVDAAVKIIRTGKNVEGEDTGSYLITKDNVDDPKIQAVLHPSCENPPL